MKDRLLNIAISLLLILGCCSCTGDLDTQPLDNNQLTENNVYSTTAGYKGALAKCYAEMVM